MHNIPAIIKNTVFLLAVMAAASVLSCSARYDGCSGSFGTAGFPYKSDVSVLQGTPDYTDLEKDARPALLSSGLGVKAYMFFSDQDPRIYIDVENKGKVPILIEKIYLYCGRQETGIKVLRDEAGGYLRIGPGEKIKDIVGYFESPYDRDYLAGLICMGDSMVRIVASLKREYSAPVIIYRKEIRR